VAHPQTDPWPTQGNHTLILRATIPNLPANRESLLIGIFLGIKFRRTAPAHEVAVDQCLFSQNSMEVFNIQNQTFSESMRFPSQGN
jgi:hypothetical protein